MQKQIIYWLFNCVYWLFVSPFFTIFVVLWLISKWNIFFNLSYGIIGIGAIVSANIKNVLNMEMSKDALKELQSLGKEIDKIKVDESLLKDDILNLEEN